MKNLCLIFLTVLILVATRTGSAQTAAEFVTRAQAAQAKGDDAELVRNANEAISRDPANALAYFLRGSGYFGLSRYDEAITDASKVIAIDPTIAAPYFLRGSALMLLRPADWKIALADFDKEIELDPTYANAFRMRAMIYTDHTEDAGAALANANQAIKLDATYADAYQERGRAETDLKKYAEADSDYTAAIRLGKNTSKIYNLRAIAKFGENKRDEAIADLRKSLELDPGNQQAKENLDYSLTHTLKTELPSAPSTVAPSSQANIGFLYALNSDTYEKMMPGLEKLFKRLTTHHYPGATTGTLMGKTYVNDPLGSDKAEFGDKLNRVLEAMRNILRNKYVGELTPDQLQLVHTRLDHLTDLMNQAASLNLIGLIPDK